MLAFVVHFRLAVHAGKHHRDVAADQRHHHLGHRGVVEGKDDVGLELADLLQRLFALALHAFRAGIGLVGVHVIGLHFQVPAEIPAGRRQRLQNSLGLRLAADMTDFVALHDEDSLRRILGQCRAAYQQGQCAGEPKKPRVKPANKNKHAVVLLLIEYHNGCQHVLP